MPKVDDVKTKLVLKKFIIVLLLLGVAIAATGLIVAGDKQPHAELPTATVKDQVFELDVADTEAEREQGLSGHKSIAEDAGMLFVFNEPGQYCFWMKDMNFPIDIVWLNNDERVVHIQKNATPKSYPNQFCPQESAKFVVELKAGKGKELNLRRGNQFELKLQ